MPMISLHRPLMAAVGYVRQTARHFRRARGGVAALEFALIGTPLLVMSFGTLEFGRLIWTREALQATAITVARCMAVTESSCASGGVYSAADAASYATSVASGWSVTLPTGDVTLNNAATCASVTGFSQVTINYTFTTMLPTLLTSLSNGIGLTVTACFPNYQT